MQENYKYNIYMFVVTIFFGMTYVLTKICLNYTKEFHIISFRFLIAFVVSLVFLYKKIFPIKRKVFFYSLFLGALLFLIFVTMTIGVKYTTSANATLDKNLKFHIGDILCLICASLFTFYIILTERIVKNNNPTALGVLQFAWVSLFSFFIQYPIENFVIPKNKTFWLCIIILGVFCTAFGYIAQTIAQKKLSSTMVGFILSLEPVFSGIFGYFFLNEYLNYQQCIGATLLLISVIYISVKN